MTKTNSPFAIRHSSEPKAPYGFAILLIFALAFALNLSGLAADNLWEDEIFTALFASRSPAEVIRWTANDIHPPLYYLLAGAFTRLTIPLGNTDAPTPASDWLWRFPSVMAGVLTVVITCKLATQWSMVNGHASRLLASAAALLLALAPIAIKYNQEARMHALFMFLAALSTWLFFRAMARPQRRTRWLAYTLALTATIYAMYFGFLILAAHAAYFGFTIYDLRFTNLPKVRRADSPPSNLKYPEGTLSLITNLPKARKAQLPIIGFSTSILVTFLLYAPWWPVLFNILRKRAAVGAIEGGVGSPLSFIPSVIRALGPLPEPAAWGFLALFVLGVILLARRNGPLAAFAALWLALPVALPLFLGDPRALQFRYAFVLPVYVVVIAYAVERMGEWANGRMGESSSNVSTFQSPISNLLTYFLWLLATLSFIATLGIYRQVKPDWRDAAAYLEQHTTPNDLILTGPLWDEGRFIDYYYNGQAQLLTPAVMLTNIQERAETLRRTGGRVWAVNRFAPAESAAIKNIAFPGVVVSEPKLAVYEPAILTAAALDLARQAVEAAYPWAAEMEAQGVLNPDPRTAKAGALRAWGDALVAAGRPQEAVAPYQTAVDIFPGWVNGYLALAETQESLGNWQAAAEAYRQAVAYNLNWRGPIADEAADLVGKGQWIEAIKQYHQIIEAK